MKDLIWLAGLFDGEGSLGVYPHKGRYKKRKYIWYRPNITIGMVDRWVINKIFKIVKCGTFVERKVRARMLKPCYIFSIQNWDDAFKFTELLLPYLQLKKPQAFLVNISARNRDNKEYLEGVSILTKQLNQRNTIWQKMGLI